MSRTKDRTDDHPLVLAALAAVEDSKRRLEDTRDDIVAGHPVSAADLAAATADVERAELLVQRARNDAAKELEVRDRGEFVARRISERATSADGNAVEDAQAAQLEIVGAIRAMWGPAEKHTGIVAALSEQARSLGDAGEYGIAVVDPYAPNDGVRTDDVVLVATPPLGILAAAVLQVLDDKGVTDEFPPDARAGLVALADRWHRAVKASTSAHPAIMSREDRAARMARLRENANRLHAEEQRRRTAEAATEWEAELGRAAGGRAS